MLRLSFAKNGLTMVVMESPRDTPFKSLDSTHYSIFDCDQRIAYYRLKRIIEKYEYKKYGFFTANCRDFTNEIR